nr:MAG TPA: hypothetical protein [Caudoviricetes sp.]
MERNNETTYLNCLFGIAPIGCNIWHIVYSPTKGLEKTKTEPYYYRVVGNSIYCNLFLDWHLFGRKQQVSCI